MPGAVDARFTLAAERTVLAWIRTALGFMAAGVAVVYIAPDIRESLLETIVGLLMVGVGCSVAVLGGWRWRRTTRALENGGPMPGPSQVMFLIAAIVVIAIAITVAVALQT